MRATLLFASGSILLLGCFDATGSGSDGSTEEFRVLERTASTSASALQGRGPRDLHLEGETLWVAASDTAGDDVLARVSVATGDVSGSFGSWTAAGKEVGFAGTITSVATSADRVFVGTTDSRVEVFLKRPFAWQTTVGTGVWWGDDSTRMVHCFALAVVDSLLLVRDKTWLRAYRLSAITEASRNRVALHARTREMGTSTAHQGIASLDGRIYVTDNARRAILVFDRGRFLKGSVDIAPTDSFPLPYAPLDVAVHRGELLVTGSGGVFESRDPADGALLRSYPAIEGHAFVSPEALSVDGDRFSASEKTTGSVLHGRIRYATMTVRP